MKKITDFIVEKRILVFIIFLVISFGSLYLSKYVSINRDITKYLPKDSETRIGMDIMEDEFGQNDSSSLNIMFKGLSNEDKKEVLTTLENIKGVDQVSHDGSKDYNKDDYTLYVIDVADYKDSKTAKNVYDAITKEFADYEYETSGDISDEYKVVLPGWIVALAICCALVILIFMCESYIEPFLFLIAIGLGVFINKGTNLIFPSISSITNSIAAILQLALSMDYSIMLMSRYRQEKETEKDNVEAMKKALAKSFSAISSSSVTTIVGLLALVFMSFTIGKDLGFVLAKGVLLSLLTIFTCLPFLILTFDGLINKFKKKAPVFKMKTLSNIAYKFRYVGILVFLAIFLFSFLFKGNLKMLYTETDSDEVKKEFKTNNQIAIIYDNKYDDMIASYCHELEKDENITDVLCYGNTLNDPLTYKALQNKLDDLGSDTNIEDYLMKIIYYLYHQGTKPNLTVTEFISFIEDNVYPNPNLNKEIDDETRQNILKLKNFTNPLLYNQKRTKQELADLFMIDSDTLNDLLIYYDSLNNNKTLTIKEFLDFLNDYVVNSKYGSSFTKEEKDNLKYLANFTNKDIINKKMTYQEMTKLLNIDEDLMNQIYLYYISLSDISVKLDLSTLVNFIDADILPNPSYNSLIKDDVKNNLALVKTFSNKNIINTKVSSEVLATYLGLDPEIVNNIYLLYFGSKETNLKLSIPVITSELLKLQSSPYLKDLDLSFVSSIPPEILASQNEYIATELAKIIPVSSDKIYLLYALIARDQNKTSDWLLSPIEFTTFLLENKTNPYLEPCLSRDLVKQLENLNFIMNSSLNETKFSYVEVSTIFKIDESLSKNIYVLYNYKYNETTITPIELINFLLNHQNDDPLKSNLTFADINNLNLLKTVSEGTINNKKYNASELNQILGIKKEDVNLLLALYQNKKENKNVSLSYKEFVNFILNNVVTNSKYKKNVDNEKIAKVNVLKTIMSNLNKEYNENELYDLLKVLASDVDKDLIEVLYSYNGSINNYDETWQMTVEEFVKYLNEDLLPNPKYNRFMSDEQKKDIKDAKKTVKDSKIKLVGDNYSRVVLNTKYALEDNDALHFVEKIHSNLNTKENKDIYLIGNTPMAHELNETFNSELNFITILTIIFIFVIVAITFKSGLIPAILVFLIQTAVFLTMGILALESGTVYFIAILIVQSILMGATIDYAILYTTYYIEARKTLDIKESVKYAYMHSVHTILTSASILTLVTLVIGYFGSATASKICITISQGTICSTVLILLILPELIAAFDKIIIKQK